MWHRERGVPGSLTRPESPILQCKNKGAAPLCCSVRSLLRTVHRDGTAHARVRRPYNPWHFDSHHGAGGMKARVKWVEGVTFLGETESSHAIVMDGAPEGGGRNLGPRPMETLLIGAGGCTAYDVVTILRRGRQDILDVAVEMDADRAAEDPKVFTRIHLHFVVKGRQVRPEAVARAVELSATKYCSASIMLGKTAAITHDFEIVEVG